MEGAKRRFRKRGGAKKKKKSQVTQDGQTDPERGTAGVSENDATQSGNEHAPDSQTLVEPDAHPTRSRFGGEGTTVYNYGGSTLDAELAQYLRQVRDDLQRLATEDEQETTATASDDQPQSVLLARNALSSLTGHLHEVAMDTAGSRILEFLLQAASSDRDAMAEALNNLLALGSQRFGTLCQHRCASHVLQSLIHVVVDARSMAFGPGHTMTAIENLIATLAEWPAGDVAAIMSHSSGTYVFREIVAGLAGLPVDEPKEQKLNDSKGSSRIKSYIDELQVDVPSEWLAAISKLGSSLVEADDGYELQSMLSAPASCGALQALLSGLVRYGRAEARQLAKACIKDSCLDLCYDACSARFMERAIVCLGPVEFLPSLKGHFAELAADGKANYVLQRLLLGLRGRGLVMSAWDELEASLPKMVGFGSAREGVVLAMIRAAEVEGDEQVRRRAARLIAKATGASGPNAKHIIGILLAGSLEMWSRWKDGVNIWADNGMGLQDAGLQTRKGQQTMTSPKGLPLLSVLGTLTARSLLRYPGSPGQIARDSMGNMSSEELIALGLDASGSRLLELWLEHDAEGAPHSKTAGSFVSAVLDKVDDNGLLGPFARNAYGAQVLSRAVILCPTTVKKRTMDALAADMENLKEDDYGRQVLRKCRVEDYLRRTDEWSAVESARDTRYRLFADILNAPEDDDGARKSSRKGKRKCEPDSAEPQSNEGEANISSQHAKETSGQDDPASVVANAGATGVVGGTAETSRVKHSKKRKRSRSVAS